MTPAPKLHALIDFANGALPFATLANTRAELDTLTGQLDDAISILRLAVAANRATQGDADEDPWVDAARGAVDRADGGETAVEACKMCATGEITHLHCQVCAGRPSTRSGICGGVETLLCDDPRCAAQCDAPNPNADYEDAARRCEKLDDAKSPKVDTNPNAGVKAAYPKGRYSTI